MTDFPCDWHITQNLSPSQISAGGKKIYLLAKTFHNATIFMKATVFIFQNKPRRLAHWSPPCFQAIAYPLLLTPWSSFPGQSLLLTTTVKIGILRSRHGYAFPTHKDNQRMTATTDVPKQDLDHGDGCNQSPHLLRNTDEEWEVIWFLYLQRFSMSRRQEGGSPAPSAKQKWISYQFQVCWEG